MDIQAEKQIIIKALQHRNEEWLIIALKKLLELDTGEAYSSEHYSIIKERVQAYKDNPENVVALEQLKNELKTEGKI